jgi:hypothetical protein
MSISGEVNPKAFGHVSKKKRMKNGPNSNQRHDRDYYSNNQWQQTNYNINYNQDVQYFYQPQYFKQYPNPHYIPHMQYNNANINNSNGLHDINSQNLSTSNINIDSNDNDNNNHNNNNNNINNKNSVTPELENPYKIEVDDFDAECRDRNAVEAEVSANSLIPGGDLSNQIYFYYLRVEAILSKHQRRSSKS